MIGLFSLSSSRGGAQVISNLEAGPFIFLYLLFFPDPTQLSSPLPLFGVTLATGACGGEFAYGAHSGAAWPVGAETAPRCLIARHEERAAKEINNGSLARVPSHLFVALCSRWLSGSSGRGTGWCLEVSTLRKAAR